jgi:hypothetical protein
LEWAEEIESGFQAWVSPGGYLGRLTLRTLLEQATGQKLPESIFRMFDTTDAGVATLSDQEKTDRKDHVSQVIHSAVLNTAPVGSDNESESESESESE